LLLSCQVCHVKCAVSETLVVEANAPELIVYLNSDFLVCDLVPRKLVIVFLQGLEGVLIDCLEEVTLVELVDYFKHPLLVVEGEHDNLVHLVSWSDYGDSCLVKQTLYLAKVALKKLLFLFFDVLEVVKDTHFFDLPCVFKHPPYFWRPVDVSITLSRQN
jgi:hypothetical protein